MADMTVRPFHLDETVPDCTGYADSPCLMSIMGVMPGLFDRGNGLLLCPTCNYRYNNWLEHQMVRAFRDSVRGQDG